MSKNATERFSRVVADYIRYRPSYPAEVVETLNEFLMSSQTPDRASGGTGISLDVSELLIADIGAGTGNLTELLLETGCKVMAIEPNADMLAACDERFKGNAQYQSCAGSAEKTGIPDQSVDLAIAAQAFHWFEPVATRKEILRVLKPDGLFALVWNQRRVDLPFHQAYESALVEYAPEYSKVNHMTLKDTDLEDFFTGGIADSSLTDSAGACSLCEFDYAQQFDLDSLKGRLMSSSYAPEAGSANHTDLMLAIDALFAQFEDNNQVDFAYRTRLFLGKLRTPDPEVADLPT